MEPIGLKIDNEEIKKSMESFALSKYLSRNKNKSSSLTEGAMACLESNYGFISSPRKAELFVNQDGLKNREYPKDKKREFKQIIGQIRELYPAEISQPFTGKLELHCANGGIKVIRLYPA